MTGPFIDRIIAVNLFLVAFNMIPAFPMNELRKLARYVGQDVTLFVSGRAVGDHTQILEEINVKFIKGFDQFSKELN